MSNENNSNTAKAADQEIARILEAGEPGVESAMKVLEMTEQHYYAAVQGISGPHPATYTASHSW